MNRKCRTLATVCVISSLLTLCGCDRVQELLGKIGDLVQPGASSGRRSALVSDHERIVRKFGQPREKIGVGTAAHTENGVRYDRKWNYYYAGRPGSKPTMRTVYFMNERYAGSVLHQPDGKIRKEQIRFSY
ncbi:MAG: hypothetical protein WCP22_05555 [Chlamydiota bacterium]